MQFAGVPPSLNDGRLAEKPIVYVLENTISAVMIVRMEATAEASFALMRDRKRFGIATAAMTRMITVTISNSISENPFCLVPI
jgi:hypothetical protein